MPLSESNANATATHLLYVGDGWIEATKVADDGPDWYAWQFWRVEDLLRWLHA